MAEQLQIIPIEEIYPNPYQPRIEFSEQELEELGQSIKKNGLIQPIIVRKSDIIGYELIAGERRLRACKRLGLKDISAVIREISDQDSKRQAIIENLQRSNLNPIEEAKAYQNLINHEGYSHEELASIMGKSRPYISNMLRLLQLPANIQESLENSVISQGHARALLGITNSEKQLTVFKTVISENWSVRQLENFLRKPSPSKKAKKNIFIKDQEKKLEQLLGMPVSIRYKNDHTGSLQIYFSTEEDFNRIINKLE